VWNNGAGIPVKLHKKEGLYVPEMVLGHLLTGSNFDDSEAKITGGRNGRVTLLSAPIVPV
jgi:DNA topoisomerase-2